MELNRQPELDYGLSTQLALEVEISRHTWGRLPQNQLVMDERTTVPDSEDRPHSYWVSGILVSVVADVNSRAISRLRKLLNRWDDVVCLGGRTIYSRRLNQLNKIGLRTRFNHTETVFLTTHGTVIGTDAALVERHWQDGLKRCMDAATGRHAALAAQPARIRQSAKPS